jgi:lysophospholipase L1-like esterase
MSLCCRVWEHRKVHLAIPCVARGHECRPPPRPLARRLWVFRLCLGSLVTIGTLLAIELGTRLYLALSGVSLDQYRFDPESMHHNIYRAHPYTLYSLEPGSRSSYQGIDVQINSSGYRGPEIRREKLDGELRIVCVGGSTTFGVYTNEPECYPRQLEAFIRRAHPDRRVSVINAGVPGFNTAETLINTVLRLVDLRPDVFVILENVNELLPRRWPNFEEDYSHFRKEWSKPRQGMLDRLLEHLSALYVLARFKFTDYKWCQYVDYYCDIDFPKYYPKLDVDLEERTVEPFRNHLVMLCRLANAYKSRPVLCTMARRSDVVPSESFIRAFEQQNEVIRVVARDERATLVDLAEELTGRNEFFSDFVHTNVPGSRQVARRVARVLEAEGALK